MVSMVGPIRVRPPWRTGTDGVKGATAVRTQLIKRKRLRVPMTIMGLLALAAGVAASAGALPSSSSSATAYVAVAPQRVLDTRSGVGAPIGKVSTATTLSFTGVAAVPTDARAVVLTLTATDGTQDSYLSVQPAG